MPSHRGGQGTPNRRGIDDAQMAAGRTGSAEAVTQLRRLAQRPAIQDVERVLADLDNAPAGPGGGIEAVRALRRSGAEYLRVADELEAAARCCRLAEREIGQRIDALLVSWDGQPGTAPAHESDAPAGTGGPRGRHGLHGWFRKLFRRGRAGQHQRGDRPVSGRHARHAPPLVQSAASSRQQHPPDTPAADVAALVLGPLELSVAGRRVLRWNSLKARSVFQYLLIHQDRPIRRDVLMELQWPDHTRNSARNNLNVALYSLRNTLEGSGQGLQPVLYQDGCYSLNPALTWWIDRNEFFSTLQHAESARRAGQPRQAIAAYEKAVHLTAGRCSRTTPPVSGSWPSSAIWRSCTCRRLSTSRPSTSSSASSPRPCGAARSRWAPTRAASPPIGCSCAVTTPSISSSWSAASTAPASPPCTTSSVSHPQKRRSSSSATSPRPSERRSYALNKRCGPFFRGN